MRAIFALITPHVARWHAFHLKVRANECKLVARQALSTCGPAPMLETLQLYHFEDYRTSRNLYIATYRAPVIIFDNVLPALKNVSLIGVNLTWSHAPYLQQLHALELALHPDSIRPPYDAWDAMLRGSPHLRQLRLHYSGPRATDEPNERVCVPGLEELSLTDLDPDHLARLLPALELPRLSTLALDLPDQDFTSVIRFIAGVRDPGAGLSPSFPIASLQILRITALECTQEALSVFLRALLSLRVLELDFARLPGETFRVLLETVTPACKCSKPMAPVPVLPRLEEALMFGLPGQSLDEFIQFRESWAASTTSCGEPRHAWRVTLPRVVVRPGHARGQDAVLTDLVEQGKVECLDDGLELELDEEDDLEPSEDGHFDEIET
ncbi:unnamed protein product [Mycena citricolor]|uniref:F-box domain-containing protein n=1 Tax=Mycena citricolor TaxID=2018698 RepID=A0AAD2HZE6_9AGAR|nr:unnamed protein product [Mycena citricolor]